MSDDEKTILAIRVRGQVRVRPQIETTLDNLLLIRLHHARLITMNQSMSGMITKVKDYITWGEPSLELIEQLLTKRGRLPGNRRLTDEYVKANSDYKSIKAFAKALVKGEAKISDVKDLKPIFRLTPPSKGYRGKTKLPIGMGGVTGYRGEGINDLAQRMI
ncbi:MAG: 50S ribosomal protein L30 [Candidatus Thorarchaeota archaeon]|nr:MAG: 50S ribosomal protein L30 [Candidatus Thorarchaeota archaeon]